MVSSRKMQCFGVRKLRFARFTFPLEVPLKKNPHLNNLKIMNNLQIITGLNGSFSPKGDLR